MEVDLGYPGPYVSTSSSPIELRVRGATMPFDGYIGYRFRVGRDATLDTPVASRAIIPAGGSWTFRTTAQLVASRDESALMNRELVVEWRNRSAALVSSRSVGRPPWSAGRPLRIVGSREPGAAQTCLGQQAVLLSPAELRDDAQWFAGFSSIVVPLDVWLDLPAATREAAFHSGVHVVFFGMPREGQGLSKIDEALLPVRFTPGPGWTPAPDADYAGPKVRPYLATTRAGSYAADEKTLGEPLPSMQGQLRLLDPYAYVRWQSPLAELMREVVGRPAVALIMVAAVLPPLLWLRARRRIDPWTLAMALVAAAFILLLRPWFRQPAGERISERWTSLRPGALLHQRVERVYGPSPLADSKGECGGDRSVVAGTEDSRQALEVRTSDTLAGHGTLPLSELPWNAVRRSWKRIELAELPPARVVDAGVDRLTIDYDLPFAAREVFAYWSLSGRMRNGISRIDSTRGRVTIVHDRVPVERVDDLDQSLPLIAGEESARIFFLDDDGTRSRRLDCIARTGHPPAAGYSLYAAARREDDRHLSWTFVLPEPGLRPGRFVAFYPAPRIPVSAVDLVGEGGTISLAPFPTTFPLVHAYRAPAAEVARVAGPHQLVRLRATLSAETADPSPYASLEVRETTP